MLFSDFLRIAYGNRPYDLELVRTFLQSLPLDQSTPFAPASDPLLIADRHQRQFGRSPAIRLGKVVYAAPYAHWYRVQLDDGGTDVGCVLLAAACPAPLTIRELSLLPPNSSVLVHTSDDEHVGLILGAIPEIVRDVNLVFPDWIDQGSNCGFRREQYYHGLTAKSAKNAGMLDVSNGRPLDGTAAGEWGKFNDLGMGLFLDNFMGYFRVDEAAGLFLYYLDRLIRLAAYNFNLETAGGEWIARNDEGEFQDYRGCTPYPWEALGARRAAIAIFRQHSGDEVQYRLPYGACEPKYDDQQPFYRTEEYRGYLGQGFFRQVLAPPYGGEPEVYRYRERNPRIGLFREQIGLDGSYALASAHSVTLAKRVLLPAPKRIRLAEDLSSGADQKSNYRFAGAYGEGPEHRIADAPRSNEGDSHLQAAAAVQEIAAYTFNWKGLHPFVYHTGDFSVPEEDELGHASQLQIVPPYSVLAVSQWLPAPDPQRVEVDHRYGEVDYYATSAGIYLLPDGGVVIRDGYGSEIRMTGGSIVLSAPGDIWRQSGRSCLDWAGDDAVIKARHSVDITSSLRDVRLKAEQNLEMLAGNGGRGRLLLENKAQDIRHNYEGKIGEEIDEGSGILFRASFSQVAAMAREIYLRTGNEDGGIFPGNIVLDAARGRANIYQIANLCYRKLHYGGVDAFFSGEKTTSTNAFFPQWNLLGAMTFVDGMLVNTRDGILTRGWVLVGEGHIVTQYAANYNGLVPVLRDESLMGWTRTQTQVAESTREMKQKADEEYQAMRRALYEHGRIGSAHVQKTCRFSLRNEAQYGTEETFFLPEAWWQKMAVATGGTTVWEERPVEYQNERLMPFPGMRAWSREDSLRKVRDRLYQTAQGLDRGRQDLAAYEDPTLEPWEKTSLESAYQVIATS